MGNERHQSLRRPERGEQRTGTELARHTDSVQVIDELLDAAQPDWNCGELAHAYAQMRLGRSLMPVTGLTHPSVAELSKRLGRPRRRREGMSYGDIVLFENGDLGINLDYCLLTVVEKVGIARVNIDKSLRYAAWQVSSAMSASEWRSHS